MIALFLLSLLTSSCSVEKLAMKKVAGLLTSSGTSSVFTAENDPEFVAEALPFAIKMYESLLASMPDHSGLRLTTGSLYIMYASAFLHTPAQMLPDDKFEKQEQLLKRAKNLYLRGRDIILTALNRKYPGFLKNLNENKFKKALQRTKKEDIPFLYWSAAGWLGAFAIDAFNMELGLTVPRAAAMMERILELDESYGKGMIHDFFISYYGSLPEYMGGSLEKARYHFKRALEISQGKSTSPYMALATTVSIKEQNLEEFKELLEKVLEIDPDSNPESRLMTILNQRKARWFLDHVEDFFLIDNKKDFSVTLFNQIK